MLKRRIIPSLLYKNGEMVKGIQFDNYKNVGEPQSTVEIYTSQDSDELMFINISDEEKYKSNFKDIYIKERSTRERFLFLFNR